MTRLRFATIAYACTTRTDTKRAYADPRWADARIQCSGIINELLYGWRQRPALQLRSHGIE